MKVRDLTRVIRRNGWYLVRTRGSHCQYKHPTKPGLVTVPGKPNDDFGLGNSRKYLETGRTKAVKNYSIVIEETNTGYSAYSPELPGCIATGATREEVEANMREAIEFHIEGLKEEGYEVPDPGGYSPTLHGAA